jgi:hypothetical protein
MYISGSVSIGNNFEPDDFGLGNEDHDDYYDHGGNHIYPLATASTSTDTSQDRMNPQPCSQGNSSTRPSNVRSGQGLSKPHSDRENQILEQIKNLSSNSLSTIKRLIALHHESSLNDPEIWQDVERFIGQALGSLKTLAKIHQRAEPPNAKNGYDDNAMVDRFEGAFINVDSKGHGEEWYHGVGYGRGYQAGHDRAESNYDDHYDDDGGHEDDDDYGY